MPARIPLPQRTPSHHDDEPPADALKPDTEAIDDVYAQVAQTGSIEAAARKLAELAHDELELGHEPANVARRQPWEDDPEEQAFLNTTVEVEDELEETEHLQEVVNGLWIGDLVAAMDAEGLRERGITNIVSLLRPRLQFAPDVAAYALEIDDAATTDILSHLPSTTAWIHEALAQHQGGPPPGEGERDPDIKADIPVANAGAVLVHCQAGMSRSATVTAAFLMKELQLDPVDAVSMVRERRSVVDPSETFWHQLGLYYQADGRVNLKDRSTRRFFLERTTGYVMNEGGKPTTEHMADYPSAMASQPQTPAGDDAGSKRKIRCKMCRRHLAMREHMMDHILDQAPPSRPPSRPRTPSNNALAGAMTAMDSPLEEVLTTERSRRPSIVSDIINPLTGLPGARSRRASTAGSGAATPAGEGRTRSRSVLGGAPEPMTMSRTNSSVGATGRKILDADELASRLPPQLAALRAASSSASALSSPGDSPPESPEPNAPRRRLSSSLALTPTERRGSSSALGGGIAPMSTMANMPNMGGPPILHNPKCSGYFVEPLTWMEPVLCGGDVNGKLICPNEKCKVKIGNFDWAGVMCGCREWVTPGFCLSRAKVEEVW